MDRDLSFDRLEYDDGILPLIDVEETSRSTSDFGRGEGREPLIALLL